MGSTAMSEDDVKGILDFGLPATWRSQMTLQGFKILESALPEFLEFCKHMESAGEQKQLAVLFELNKKDKDEGRRHKKQCME